MMEVEARKHLEFERALAGAPLWALAVVLALGGLAAMVASRSVGNHELWTSLTATVAQSACAILWLARFVPREGYSIGELLGDRIRGRNWAWTLLALASSLILSMGLLRLELALSSPEHARRVLLHQAHQPGLAHALYKLVAFVVVAPLIEEMLFRGVLFRKWRYTKGAIWGVMLSSALFAICHAADLLGSMLFGIVAALLYTRTRTLWAPVAAHALHNGFAVALALSRGEQTAAEAAQRVGEMEASSWPALVLVGLGLPGTLWFVCTSWKTLGAPLPPFSAR